MNLWQYDLSCSPLMPVLTAPFCIRHAPSAPACSHSVAHAHSQWVKWLTARARNTSKVGTAAATTITTLRCLLVHFPQHGTSGSSQLPGVGAPRSQHGDMGSQPRGPKHSGMKVLPKGAHSAALVPLSPRSQLRVVVWGAVKSKRMSGWVGGEEFT